MNRIYSCKIQQQFPIEIYSKFKVLKIIIIDNDNNKQNMGSLSNFIWPNEEFVLPNWITLHKTLILPVINRSQWYFKWPLKLMRTFWYMNNEFVKYNLNTTFYHFERILISLYKKSSLYSVKSVSFSFKSRFNSFFSFFTGN